MIPICKYDPESKAVHFEGSWVVSQLESREGVERYWVDGLYTLQQQVVERKQSGEIYCACGHRYCYHIDLVRNYRLFWQSLENVGFETYLSKQYEYMEGGKLIFNLKYGGIYFHKMDNIYILKRHWIERPIEFKVFKLRDNSDFVEKVCSIQWSTKTGNCGFMCPHGKILSKWSKK